MFPINGECLIGISDTFFAFCLWVSVILPTCSLYPQQKRAYSALHPQALTYINSSMPVGTYQVQSLGFPKIVYSAQIWVGTGDQWRWQRRAIRWSALFFLNWAAVLGDSVYSCSDHAGIFPGILMQSARMKIVSGS